jgi:heme A synthase
VVQVLEGGLACPEFPLCGAWWPGERGAPAQVHMLHRYLALLVGVLVAVAALPSTRRGGARRAIRVVAVLYALQVLVGVAQVMSDMSAGLRWAHLGLGAAFWAAVVALTAANRIPVEE